MRSSLSRFTFRSIYLCWILCIDLSRFDHYSSNSAGKSKAIAYPIGVKLRDRTETKQPHPLPTSGCCTAITLHGKSFPQNGRKSCMGSFIFHTFANPLEPGYLMIVKMIDQNNFVTLKNHNKFTYLHLAHLVFLVQFDDLHIIDIVLGEERLQSSWIRTVRLRIDHHLQSRN